MLLMVSQEFGHCITCILYLFVIVNSDQYIEGVDFVPYLAL